MKQSQLTEGAPKSATSSGKLRRRTAGFTLVELLVVIAIIGILVALLLPAVQMAREAARKSHCANNLKQLGLAFATFHEAQEFIPPSALSEHKATWAVHILPELEQQALYDEWDLTRCFYDQTEIARTTVVPQLLCTSRPRKTSVVSFTPDSVHKGKHGSEYMGSVSDYDAITSSTFPGNYFFPWKNGDGAVLVGSHKGLDQVNSVEDIDTVPNIFPLVLTEWRSRTTWAHIRDGRSNTTLLAECSKLRSDSTQAFSGDLFHGIVVGPEHPIGSEKDPKFVADSSHSSVCYFVFCDGHVKALSKNTDGLVLGKLTTRDGGEPVSASDY